MISAITNVIFSFHLDLLPDRIDFDSVIMSFKTIFTAKQKAELEAKFRSNKYPTRKEKVALAAKLDIGVTKVQVCLWMFASLDIIYL